MGILGYHAEELSLPAPLGSSVLCLHLHPSHTTPPAGSLLLLQGGLSEEASKALRLLRSLPPGEFLGVVCCLLDDLGGEPSAKQAPVVASCCEDVSAFAAGVAKRCWDRASAAQGDK